MLPPYPGTLPKGTRLLSARSLSVGDLIFLDSAASSAPVRSLIIKIRGNQFMVMNGLNPEPYEVHLPHHKQVWALKQKPRRTDQQVREDDGREREPFRNRPRTGTTPQEAPAEDFRHYWTWDPNDPRAKQEYHAVEEREWRRLHSWWEKKKAKKPPPKPPPKKRRIDGKSAGWYKLLGLRPGSSPKELKSAFKKAAFKYHPDRCKDSNAEEMFKKISEAYKELLAMLEKQR